MTQTLLKEHINNTCIEICPQCLNCLTPYWSIKKVERISEDLDLITEERTCSHCKYHEEDTVETMHISGCFSCNSGCDGGCK